MVDKFKEAMNDLYSEAKAQADRYRNLEANVSNCYFEFSHELVGVTIAACYVCATKEHLALWEYATELRNKFWKEEVEGVR